MNGSLLAPSIGQVYRRSLAGPTVNRPSASPKPSIHCLPHRRPVIRLVLDQWGPNPQMPVLVGKWRFPGNAFPLLAASPISRGNRGSTGVCHGHSFRRNLNNGVIADSKGVTSVTAETESWSLR